MRRVSRSVYYSTMGQVVWCDADTDYCLHPAWDRRESEPRMVLTRRRNLVQQVVAIVHPPQWGEDAQIEVLGDVPYRVLAAVEDYLVFHGFKAEAGAHVR